MPDHEPAHRDHGSLEDLIVSTLMPSRRRALMLFATATLPASLLAACGGGGAYETYYESSSSSSSSASSSSSSSSSSSGTCSVPLPEETNGPYPGDGSNTVSGSVVNVLGLTGIVRSDIRSSLSPYSGTAAGVPLTLTITLDNTNLSCNPLAGYAVYIWHCTADGKYSLYTDAGENYLRGVQVTDANGSVTFTTIVPGCYSGRMPHIHVEVYASLSTATSYTNRLRTTQFAFDRAFSETFYATASGYGDSAANLAAITFATDNVFGDDTTSQLAASTLTPTGSMAGGYTASINLGIEQ